MSRFNIADQLQNVKLKATETVARASAVTVESTKTAADVDETAVRNYFFQAGIDEWYELEIGNAIH